MAINLFGRDAVFRATATRPIDDDAEQLDIPIHAFDVIVADECHRGYTSPELSVWREHARPLRRDQDRPDRDAGRAHARPTSRTWSTATSTSGPSREGYLVDYDVVDVQVGRPHERRLPEGGRGGRTRRHRDRRRRQLDQLEDERQFDTTEIERKVTAPDSNRKILEELKKYADEHEAQYGRFPKTLIFAANDLPHTSHADQLVDICARRLRPRRRVRPEDHRAASTGRCSASASSATGRTRHRRSRWTC